MSFICNNKKYNKLYDYFIGPSGLISVLSNNKYPMLIVKFYKEINDIKIFDKKHYDILYKYNLTPKLLDIQNFDQKLEYEYNKNDKIHKSKLYNKVYYYEISGFCNVLQFLKICKLSEYIN